MPQYNQKATIELFESIEEQAAEKVVRALNHGGDPNGTDEEDRKFGITPMHSACMGQKTDILRLLVTYGGKLDAETEYGRTPLSYAVQKNNRNMVKLLHDGCKVDINVKFIKGEMCTPLILASKNGHVDIVKLLLKWGADLDETDLDGKTAEQYADEKGFIKIMEMIQKARSKREKAAAGE